MTSRAVTRTCPNCGGPLDLERSGEQLLKCPYCGRSVEIEPAAGAGVSFEAETPEPERPVQRTVSRDGPWKVGRGESCDIVIKDSSLSRFHALIQRLPDGTFSIMDLGSSNGVHVQAGGILGGLFGRKGTFRQIEGATVVAAGDAIRIGDVETTVADLLARAGLV